MLQDGTRHHRRTAFVLWPNSVFAMTTGMPLKGGKPSFAEAALITPVRHNRTFEPSARLHRSGHWREAFVSGVSEGRATTARLPPIPPRLWRSRR